MTWKPGVSGNPSGRPRVAAEVRELAREHTTTAVAKLVELLQSSDPWVALASAQQLLDRGYGKPAAAVSIDAQLNSPAAAVPRIEAGMSAVEAAEIYARMIERQRN